MYRIPYKLILIGKMAGPGQSLQWVWEYFWQGPGGVCLIIYWINKQKNRLDKQTPFDIVDYLQQLRQNVSVKGRLELLQCLCIHVSTQPAYVFN